MRYRNYAVIGMTTVALAACGGGGSGGGNNGGSSDGGSTPQQPAYTQAHLEQINAIGTRMMGLDGHNASIAVVDTGVDGENAAFGSRLVAGHDSLANDGDRTYKGTALTDASAHGTAVASMAGGKNVGVAPGATIVSYKTLISLNGGQGTAANNQESLDVALATKKPYVMNFSFNTPLDPSVNDGPRSKLRNTIIEGITNNDWVVVAAAGNTGGNTELGASSADESVFRGQVLVVGAVDSNNQLANFSASATTGSELKGDAGNTFGVVEHFLVAPGAGVCTALTTSNAQSSCAGSLSDNASESYTNKSGTSFATPLVSGAVAVIRSAYPSLTGKQIVDVLLDSAKDLGAPGVDATYGAGLLDVGAALKLAAQRAAPAAK